MKSPRERIGATYRTLSQRLGKQLLDEMLGKNDFRPGLSISRIGAFIVATIIYALWLAMLIGGAALTLNSAGFLFIPIGLALLVLCFATRPRIPRMPKTYAAPQEYPKLFALVKRVAEALRTQNVHAIVFEPEYNAAFGRLGWRRHPVLFLGLALYETLDPPERLALIGHELAHGVNHDPMRGWYVGTAFYTVLGWFQILHVRERDGFLGTLINAGMYVFSFIPLGLSYALAYLMWRDSQRAEYFADYLAAQVAGKDAQLGLLRKLRAGAHLEHLVHSMALNPSDRNFFHEMRMQVQANPNDAIEDMPDPDGYELEAAHPPTEYRIKFIRERGALKPSVIVTAKEWAALEAELEPARAEVQQELIDGYLRTKYY